jgi:hypothetical protein
VATSTVKLQNVVDYVRVGGALLPATNTAGYAVAPLLQLGTDVMADIISQRFNWKFNSFKCPPFYTNSWQQDYPSVNQRSIGWLEHCTGIDINNTSLPKPYFWPECVRDIDPSNSQQSPAQQVSWEYNSNLRLGVWPGQGSVYTSPLNAVQLPVNGPTGILDANGNILLLTTYGTTGSTAPLAIAGAVAGTVINDGTCAWTVCDPSAQGFRLSALPPQQGIVYQYNVVAQNVPPIFTSLQQTLAPLPDDYSRHFRRGFIIQTYQISEDPRMREMFPGMRQEWLQEIGATLQQGDREAENKGFYPDRSVTGQDYFGPIGPANPYRWR